MKQRYRIPSGSILRRSKFLFDVLKRTSDNYIFVHDLKEDLSMLSPNLIADFDLSGEIIKGMVLSWSRLIHPEDKEEFVRDIEALHRGLKCEHDMEYRVKNRRGEYVWIRCRGRVVNDAEEVPSFFGGVMTRMGQKNQADNITGLLNKYQFEHAVKIVLNEYRATGQGGVLMVFGLDNFKIVNETYNRFFGDQVLKYVAQRIENILPTAFTLYKLDGDEFGIVYPGATVSDVEEFFCSVQRCMMRPQEIDNKMYFCTVSAGTVFYPQSGKDYLVLHKHAEAALDMAKRNGKNKNCLFTKEHYNRWVRSISMRDALINSVENGCRDFSLFYQPQVAGCERHIIGAEALLRWKNPKGRMVAPMEFIPILEETKIIIPVGKWIFEEAVRTCKEWQKYIPDFRMSVNVSYEQIKDGTFKDFVCECIAQYEIKPQTITLELTESCIVSDWSFVNKQFDFFRQQGISIAMDDFGTGYSSLGYLKNLSCNIVKIDRNFVKEILLNTFDRQLVEYTVKLCHSVGMLVCIEGVEEMAEYHLLTDKCNADMIQGYLFGHPESKEDFVRKFIVDKEILQVGV
jgi:diguanylate cyclase (GGDEF)-like protein/PAS domain S-box-containing protein